MPGARLCLQICLTVIALTVTGILHAQFEQPLTNAELNTQKLFIEANREKLLGSYEKAASLYQEVLELDSENDAARYELARVYEAMGENDKAVDYISRAIKSSPENEWYYVMKGDILEGMEEYAAAVDVYDKLIQLNPDQGYYYEHLVGLLKKTNQPGRALEVLNKHEQVAGVLPDLIFEKVEIYNVMGEPEKAIPELEKLVHLYPGSIPFLHRLAAQHLTIGDTVKASEYYNRILGLDPEDSQANLALAAQYKKDGDDQTYLRSIQGLMANPAVSLDAKILELIPYVEKFSRDPQAEFGPQLESIIADLSTQYPTEAKAHAIYADYLFSKGELHQARKEYERTLTLDKSVFAVWEQLLFLKLEQQDYDGLLSTSEQALDVFPNQASIYYLRGVAFSRKHDWQGAIRDLQQALIMTGRNVKLQGDVLVLLARTYEEAGQHDKAIESFERAVKVQPQDVAALNDYAYLLAVSGESLAQAKVMATKALELSPDNPNIEHTLGWIAFRSNDIKNARIYMDKSIDHGGGDDYHILEHYGDVLVLDGAVDEAIEYWQLSLERGNPSAVLKRKITERRLIH